MTSPFNLLQPCEAAHLEPKPWMRQEEIEALDVLCHLIQPELVVETGTRKGGSALLFERHCEVITVDPTPIVPLGTFDGKQIRQILGRSPDVLETAVYPLIQGRRWFFFHDSVHTAEHLITEIEWAFFRGAVAACWHDAGFRERSGSPMLQAIPKLQKLGYAASRLQRFEVDEVDWGVADVFSGIGLAWNRFR